MKLEMEIGSQSSRGAAPHSDGFQIESNDADKCRSLFMADTEYNLLRRIQFPMLLSFASSSSSSSSNYNNNNNKNSKKGRARSIESFK